MDLGLASKDASWWLFTLPAFLGTTNLFDAFVILSFFITFATIGLLTWAFAVGGIAWKNDRNHKGTVAIPGPRGLPIFGSIFKMSRGLAHRTLAAMATSRSATQLMAFSLGSTPVVVASDPHTAREILTSPYFADRPIKESAMKLMFDRAMGFAPNGTYWRFLRRIASSQLFAFKRIAAYEPGRQLDCSTMLNAIANEQSLEGKVGLRKHLQAAALNNIMGSVFGKRYDVTHDTEELKELHEMVREGFELLGAFNLSDYLPWLSYFYDPYRIKERCAVLVPKVKKFVGRIIEEHQQNGGPTNLSDDADFVDVMLSLEGEEKMEKDDMIAVLWVRLVNHNIPTLEWVMAELVLNQDIQGKLQKELDDVVGSRKITDADIVKLPYLQAVVKETLRVHPPGPLLSWARLSTSDVHLSNGMIIPSNTTAMVNMWHITHDPKVWKEPLVFKPERFVESDGGANVDVRGSDLRLAPFGAGRRVCPGKNLGLATVNLWVAKLVQNFKWVADQEHSVDFSEVLKLSCEMKHPLIAQATPRNIVASF